MDRRTHRRRRVSLVCALCAAILSALGLCACGGGIRGDAVAVVNGAPITRPTLDHWMEVAAAPGKASAASNQRYKMLETEVLGYLITADWLIGESASLSVKLSDAEVKHQLVREKLAEFPRAAQFEAYLHESRETVSDLLLNVKLHMLEQKLRTREKNGFTAFVKRLEKRWTARTECRAGYVVPDCREYRAPKAKG